MTDENGPYIYINGKYTPCTLDEMIQQYIEGHQHRYDHYSDGRPWLTDLIDLLITERGVFAKAREYSRNPEELDAIAYRVLLELGDRGQLILDRQHLLFEVDARDKRIAELEKPKATTTNTQFAELEQRYYDNLTHHDKLAGDS